MTSKREIQIESTVCKIRHSLRVTSASCEEKKPSMVFGLSQSFGSKLELTIFRGQVSNASPLLGRVDFFGNFDYFIEFAKLNHITILHATNHYYLKSQIELMFWISSYSECLLFETLLLQEMRNSWSGGFRDRW